MSFYNKFKSNPKYGERLFIIFSFLFFTAWAVVQPYNAGPDEYMRYQIPTYIYQNGVLPHGGDPAIRNEIWGTSYGFFPILSYMIAAAFMKAVSFFTRDGMALLIAARMVSVLFGTGTVYFLIKLGNRIFGKRSKWLFVALAAMLPEAVFITSYVNNDSMAIFSTVFIVYMWIRGIDTKWNLKTCIGLGAAMSVCVLSYYDAYGFLLCSAVLFTVTSLLCQGDKKEYGLWFKKAAFMMMIVIVLTGWWFIRNALIYDGDILGIATNDAYANQYAQPEYKPSLNQTPFKQGMSVFDLVASNWTLIVFRSFVGVFGYMNVLMSTKVYIFYFAVFVLGLIGCCMQMKKLFSIRESGQWRAEGFFHWMLLLALLISNGLNIYHSYMVDYQPQGRYSLPMLIPLMYFTTSGIGYLIGKLPIDQKKQRIIVNVLAFIIVAIAIYAFVRVIIPVYVMEVTPELLPNSVVPDIG